mmetsp:Transcript_27448/g.69813  ORF Transcript_27448/g.69813 Transcript_27448/m.69813 type:complete len:942 (-) Transcript_27448:1022-3847(-)
MRLAQHGRTTRSSVQAVTSVCTHGWRRPVSRPAAQTPAVKLGRRHVAWVPTRSTGVPTRPVVTTRASASILPLGFDLLTFLTSTVVVVPLFKKLKISPVLGFLFSGVVLHQLGLIRDQKDMEALSELGVLFLLFEMGLELSLDRLKALAKYAFGLGTLQVVLCTGIFTAFALPAGSGLGTHILESVAHAPHSLVSIRSVDEAVVIGCALSMSSSAFVLQLLSERGELPTRVGSATLGILLLQDIAVVPFLVLLPLVVQMQTTGIGMGDMEPASLLALLGPTALKTCLGLGALLVGGRLLLRRVFEVVAQSDNSETFVGLCLLTVAGAALLTKSMGFSDTMGAFIAGVLLSESNYKAQVEADIRPFRGLLLGLFFVTTGSSINMEVLRNNWEVIGFILAGLLVVKTSVISALGPAFGLSRNESLRTGFMLSQGGEFAFVLLSLANSLKILPENLNQVLIIVVVLSMAVTPVLAETGKVVADWSDEVFKTARPTGAIGAGGSAAMNEGDDAHHELKDHVVICGFGPQGQMLAALLDAPMASVPETTSRKYIAFDLDPARVQAARSAGYKVVYGDGSRAAVLKAAGVVQPRMIAVCLPNKVNAHRAVATLRTTFPTTPIYALASDIRDAAELEEAGADRCIAASTSTGLALGSEVLARLGASVAEVSRVEATIEEAMATRTTALAERLARYGQEALDREGSSVLISSERSSASTVVSQDHMPDSSSSDGPFVEQIPSPEIAMPASMSARAATPRAATPRAAAAVAAGEGAGAVVATVASSNTSPEPQETPVRAPSNGVAAMGSPSPPAEPVPVVLQASSKGNGSAASSANGTNGSSSNGSSSSEGTKSTREDGMVSRNAIQATAVAVMECQDDEECVAEWGEGGQEIAGLVMVDAPRQVQQDVLYRGSGTSYSGSNGASDNGTEDVEGAQKAEQVITTGAKNVA